MSDAMSLADAAELPEDPAALKALLLARRALPDHLPRIEVVVEPERTACPCCGSNLRAIGEDVLERLDGIPAQLRVIVTRRPRYACRRCAEGVAQAPAPERLVAGGLPSEAMVAHVLVSGYADHTALHRQAQIHARQRLQLDRSTLAERVDHATRDLRPVHARLVEITPADRDPEALGEAVRRRDQGAGARSGTGTFGRPCWRLPAWRK